MCAHRPANRGSQKVHGGVVRIAGILHPVQRPPQKPGPDRQHHGGGQALGVGPGEDHLQHEQAQPTTEDRTVSFALLFHYVAFHTV